MKNYLVAAGTAAVVALVIALSLHGTKVVQQNLGAVASPDIQSPYFSVGGMRTWSNKSVMRTASTSVCSIQAPAATSTLLYASARFDSGNGYLTTYEFGASAAQGATTTVLARYTFASGANLTGNIVSTTTTALADMVLVPNAWINLNVATSSASSLYAPSGECQAEFRQL